MQQMILICNNKLTNSLVEETMDFSRIYDGFVFSVHVYIAWYI